jgi:hypothetical protein
MSDLSIEEQAYAHLKAWCRKHDPDGNLDPLEQIDEKDFIYEEGMTPEEYIYGKPLSEYDRGDAA